MGTIRKYIAEPDVSAMGNISEGIGKNYPVRNHTSGIHRF